MQDTVNIQERWYSDRVEVYVSSPDGWKLLRTERFERAPFVTFSRRNSDGE